MRELSIGDSVKLSMRDGNICMGIIHSKLNIGKFFVEAERKECVVAERDDFEVAMYLIEEGNTITKLDGGGTRVYCGVVMSIDKGNAHIQADELVLCTLDSLGRLYIDGKLLISGK